MFLQVSTEGVSVLLLVPGPMPFLGVGYLWSMSLRGWVGIPPLDTSPPSKEHGIYPIPGTEFAFLLPPANKVCEGYVFTGVCPQGKGSSPLHAGIHPPGRHFPCAVHAGIRSTSGGTHPTGMHSRLFINLGV